MSVISTLDQLIAAPKQRLMIARTASQTGVPFSYQELIAVAGNPGAGTLAGNTPLAGVLQTDLLAGYPIITPFGASATGYLSRLEISNTVPSRVSIYDVLWKAGAYTFNQNTAAGGITPISYSSRIPGGTDYTNLELWYEQITAGTNVPIVTVNYNNEVPGAVTTGPHTLPSAMIVGRMFQIPLVAGGKGISGVTGVQVTGSTVGTFNLLVMRKIGEARIQAANQTVIQGPLETGMPVVFADSAFSMIVASDSTATGIPNAYLDIANG